jgi:hypothetical protein
MKFVFPAVLVLFLLAGCGWQRQPQEAFDGDALSIDSRYEHGIFFSALGMGAGIEGGAYLRIDPRNLDAAEHVRLVSQEMGVTGKVGLLNVGDDGGELYLRFRDGKRCSVIWVKPDADERITKARLEHQKYHAFYHLAPDRLPELSAHMAQHGFRINLSDYDEETGATLLEVASRYLDGVAFEDIHGSELVGKAVRILQDHQWPL